MLIEKNLFSRYIRFIYNRVILESAPVRAAAVAAMAQFGALCLDLRPNIQVRTFTKFVKTVLETE